MNPIKNHYYILLTAFTLLGGIAKAQSTENWQPLMFASGMNSFKGVEGFCTTTNCGGVESILIKWINHNSYPVKAGWKDAVYTLDNRQMNSNTLQDSISLAPNSETAGRCGGDMNQLILKFSYFGTDIKNFNYLIALDFDIVKTN
jgi:hypothetical protein